MSLIKRSTNGKIPALRTNLSEFFDIDDFFPNFLESPWENRHWQSRIPAANIEETDESFIINLAAPGLRKSDFHVTMKKGKLEIKAERAEERSEEEHNFTRKEYNYQNFFRSFELPNNIQDEKINAEYHDGILKVVLPKVAQSEKKKVKEIAIS